MLVMGTAGSFLAGYCFERCCSTVRGDGAGPAGERDHAGLHDFPDAVGLEHPTQRRQLVSGAGGLDGHGVGGDVDDLGPEHLGHLEDLGAHRRVGADLEHHELALDRRRRLQLDDLDDVHQLVELLGDLLEGELVDAHADGHPRDAGLLGRPDGERLDVVAAPREQARDAGQHAGLVLDEDREDVGAHRLVSRGRWSSLSMSVTTSSAPPASGSSNSGRMSRAAMIWSLPVPAATMGQTCASAPTVKSMTTGRSVTAMACLMTRSTLSLDSHRRPSQPSAWASRTKSGTRCLWVPSSVLE